MYVWSITEDTLHKIALNINTTVNPSTSKHGGYFEHLCFSDFKQLFWHLNIVQGMGCMTSCSLWQNFVPRELDTAITISVHSDKKKTAWCSTFNDKQDNGIPLNVHHFCTKGGHCCTMGISTEYCYSNGINLAFKRLYAKGYKHWHRLQNLAASLSLPFVLQLCGISPLSCSNLLSSSEITVYVSMGYKASTHMAQHKHKNHTHLHTYIHEKSAHRVLGHIK
jgi:hypothetical protein